ncbi:MAG: aminomethyl-transferring glycine dehydrogenase subunit GcvPA, partial [Thermoprotei archaeon]
MPHNWIPNSSPDVKKELMRELGISDVLELFSDVPAKIILNRNLSVGFGKPLTEYEMRRLFNDIVSKNRV